ncbi:MAG: DNA topoisomerase IV [Flavobacteriaceae bacterium]|nr:DNA topoisomerase IV [Flavobacteriaceae bacterium]|tara:strand:- start:24946 stop:25479 length:534 start_codon:yes stop_codon:yes gene_type:complete
MKKTLLLIAIILAPMVGFSQGFFDKFEDEKDVTAVVVTKNMFKLLAEIDIESDDPEVKDYMEMVNSLDNIKIYITENKEVAGRMKSSVTQYLSKSNGLNELMRVKEDTKNIKFYSKQGKDQSHVSELLMFLEGDVDGKDGTIIMSITGNIDLKQISKLTKQMNIPGGNELENLEKKG